MIALAVQYLTGYASATDPTNREKPEWPVHPGRIHMAMAAAWFESERKTHEREALLWLENLGAPSLYIPDATCRTTLDCFVPVNDRAISDKGGTLQSAPGLPRLRQPRTFPKAYLGDEVLYVCWPDANPPPQIVQGLSSVCEKVTRIGHSSSLVQMWLELNPSIAPNLHPADLHFDIRLRVGSVGLLNGLAQWYETDRVDEYDKLQIEAAFAEHPKARREAENILKEKFKNGPPISQRPKLSLWQGYRRGDDHQESPVRGTVFETEFLVLRLQRKDSVFRQLGLRSTLDVCGRIRDALMQIADARGIRPIPSFLSGHTSEGGPLQEPHLSIFPLANCAHEHADGGLKGIGLALPRSGSASDQAALRTCLSDLRQNGLKLGRLGVWTLEPDQSASPPLTIQPKTWTAFPKGAELWGTVTPFVYDQHAKSRDKGAYYTEAATLVAEACERVGLPKPREVVITPVSPHLGAPPGHEFPRLKRKDGSERRHTHAIIIFNEPVEGPLLLGAGRYRGYGVCRPLSSL